MRILQAVGWYYPDTLGGTEVYVAGLCRRLRGLGHDVLVAAPDPAHLEERSYEHEGVPVYRYPIPASPTRAEAQGSAPVRGSERFATWLARQRPDVVHVHTLCTGLGLPEIKAAKALGARVIVTCHSSSLGWICQRGTLMRWGRTLCDGVCQTAKCAACVLQERGLPSPLARMLGAMPPSLGRPARTLPGKLGTALCMSDLISRNQAMQREMLASVDKLVLLTGWTLEAVAANRAPRHKLVLNRLGLSHSKVSPKPGPTEQPTETPIKIGYLGRFEALKGVHDLARAVASLPPEVPLLVEFRGPSGTPAERALVGELRRWLKGDPRVTFAPAVPHGEVLEILAGYDVLSCPSVCQEGGPTVAIEAHAVGTPVVGTRIGGLAELVTDGVNGRLVTPGDWRGLARILAEMAHNPAETIDRWRLALPVARTMDEIVRDYDALYAT